MSLKSTDPPKRPPTAYMLFTSERRQKVKEDNPHSTFGELGKILGDLWAKLPDAQKIDYKEKATKAMEAYKKDLAEWKRTYPKLSQQLSDEKKRKRQDKAEKKKKKMKKQKKDPNTPKRAMSAFMFYSQEHRSVIQEKNSDVSFGEIGRILGAEWKKLSDAEREKYVKKAEADRERYHKEMENYKNSHKQNEPPSSESDSESDSGSDSS